MKLADMDRKLIERGLEPVVQEIEGWTGIGLPTLIRFFVMLWVMTFGFAAMSKGIPFYYALLALALIVGGFLFLFPPVHAGGRSANVQKVSPVLIGLRLTLLFLTVLGPLLSIIGRATLDLQFIQSASNATLLYLIACDRLPPKERWVTWSRRVPQ